MEFIIPEKHVLRTRYHSDGGDLANASDNTVPLLLNFLHTEETGRIKLAKPPRWKERVSVGTRKERVSVGTRLVGE